MSLRAQLDKIEVKFQQALANPREGYFPVIRAIRPYVKRPPFNRTYAVKGRKHRPKSNNPDHYNVPCASHYAIRWIKQKNAAVHQDDIRDMEQFSQMKREMLLREVAPNAPEPEQQQPHPDDRPPRSPPALAAQSDLEGMPELEDSPPPPPPPVIPEGGLFALVPVVKPEPHTPPLDNPFLIPPPDIKKEKAKKHKPRTPYPEDPLLPLKIPNTSDDKYAPPKKIIKPENDN